MILRYAILWGGAGVSVELCELQHGRYFFFIKCLIIMAHRAWVCDVTIWYWYTQYHMVLVAVHVTVLNACLGYHSILNTFVVYALLYK